MFFNLYTIFNHHSFCLKKALNSTNEAMNLGTEIDGARVETDALTNQVLTLDSQAGQQIEQMNTAYAQANDAKTLEATTFTDAQNMLDVMKDFSAKSQGRWKGVRSQRMLQAQIRWKCARSHRGCYMLKVGENVLYSLYFFTLLILKFIYIYVLYYVFIYYYYYPALVALNISFY